MWKRLITATVLVLSAGSALAMDAQGTLVASAVPTSAVSHTAQSASVRDLAERVGTLEREVDQLTPPAPTPQDRRLAQREQDNDARLIRHAWTDGG